MLESNPDKWEDTPLEELIKLEEFLQSCYECPEKDDCLLVDDSYNTRGNCPVMK